MSEEEFDLELERIGEEWMAEIMAGFWRDGEGYIEVDPVQEFMDEVRNMING